MVDIPQLARVYDLLDAVGRRAEAVDDADVERLARLVLHPLHLQRLGIRPRRRLLRQHVLPRPQRVDRHPRVVIRMRADRYAVDLRVVQYFKVIRNSLAAAVLLHGRLRLLRDQIAEILDLAVRIRHIRRDVGAVGDAAAADDTDV